MSRPLRLRVRIRRREDRLSGLPDSLLDHILSFLPTKDAVATSILSKRWKPIWRSQRIIYLDDTSFPHTAAFRQFFNSFITMRDNTLPILSFHLKSRHHRCNHLYQDFVYPAITRGKVENLIIDLSHFNTLPPSVVLLSSKTLSVLKLKRIEFNEGFPTVVDLPLLKVLHLESVTFIYIADLHKLVSACPILQELQTNYLRILTMPPFPLRRKQTPPLPPPPPLGIAISNLVRANIIYTDDDSIFGLEWLHNVDHLHIQLNTTSPTIRGVFYNLTHLELIFNVHAEQYAFFKWRWLTKLLQNTPNLQTLIIHELVKVEDDVRRFPIKEREWEDPEIVPECLLSHLTTCSLRNYTLINSELRFAKYIMQNSRLLSTITIQSAKFLDTNTKLQMLIQLSSCPRISPTSKLFFI